MEKKFIWISIIGIIISFAGGFMLANALNRSEMAKIQAENTRLEKEKTSPQNNEPDFNLTDEEIQTKIAEAKENPDNFGFQKGLGLGLYRYAALKQDKKLLQQVTALLERANNINPDDYQVLVSLGNIYYDLGQLNKDVVSNLKARDFYKKALDKNAKDTNVRTDYGLTFLLTEEPNREVAIKEFEKALETNPQNEKALIYITQAYAEEKNHEETQKYLSKLKEVNPKNERISELEVLISQQNKQ